MHDTPRVRMSSTTDTWLAILQRDALMLMRERIERLMSPEELASLIRMEKSAGVEPPQIT